MIQLICDSQSPCDIDELLVVTFTNAAAAEMREKIGAALLKRVASDKTGRLRRQLSLLGGAKIETVHAFCLDLIKENYALCGLPADFSGSRYRREPGASQRGAGRTFGKAL